MAFTLLEVVVGLTLMASVLVSSLLAFSAHHRQRRFADAKLQAVQVADELLLQLSGSTTGIPPTGRGAIASKANWFWQTNVIGNSAPAGIPLNVIRFQIVEIESSGVAKPLATVDVVEAIR